MLRQNTQFDKFVHDYVDKWTLTFVHSEYLASTVMVMNVRQHRKYNVTDVSCTSVVPR
jgi:hypothetical protein